jgi:hypothetical protein
MEDPVNNSVEDALGLEAGVAEQSGKPLPWLRKNGREYTFGAYEDQGWVILPAGFACNTP